MIRQVQNVHEVPINTNNFSRVHKNMYIPEEYYDQYFYDVEQKMVDDGNAKAQHGNVEYNYPTLNRRRISKDEFLKIYRLESGENKIKFDEELDFELYISVEYKGETLYAIPYKLETNDLKDNGTPWRVWIPEIPCKTIFTEEYINFIYKNDKLEHIRIGSVDDIHMLSSERNYDHKRTMGLIRYQDLIYGSDVKGLTNLKEIPYYKDGKLITENREYYYNLFMKKVCRQLDSPICKYIYDNVSIIRNNKSSRATA